MVADSFKNLLQGSLLRRFRYIIMEYVHINDILMDSPFPLKERVKKYKSMTENDEENNSNKLYAEIFKLNGKIKQ